jgi:hypothetical protein
MSPLAIGAGIGATFLRGPGAGDQSGCVHCNVLKLPVVSAPGSITRDVQYTQGGTIYGGDFAALGDAGCATVRHEIRFTSLADTTTPFTANNQLAAAWDEIVLDNAPVSQAVTFTTAMWTALGSEGAVNIWIVSYTCDDFDINYDYGTSGVA